MLILCMFTIAQAQEARNMKLSVLRDKIRGGWAGQMVGVAYGAPTEFSAVGWIIEREIKWDPSMAKRSINQDDLYVEMTFAEVMDRIGLDATTEQYGDAFRDSKYLLWHANAGARRLLNIGIKAPMSGHPKYNMHANDIDFQIEADFIGIMTPGMPQRTIELTERVGHVMNYGDGVYGGTFVCGMYSAGFFEKDVGKVVQAGVDCLPKGSRYRAIIEDVIATHKKHPHDWRKCWEIINKNWDKDDSCPDGAMSPLNIEASINGAYIAIGMLYGEGDMGKTLEVSTRCGQDSDCNPSSSAGVLGVMYGFEGLGKEWVGGIEDIGDEKFSFTNYSFNDIIESSMKRAMEAVRISGGEVHDDHIVIPHQDPIPAKLEQWSIGIPIETYPVSDPAWKLKGDWKPYSDEEEDVENAIASEKGGNEAYIEFSGSAVALLGSFSQKSGMAEVYIDGEKQDIINGYIPKGTYDPDLWHKYGLEEGKHTLRIVTLDKSDKRSRGKRVVISAIKTFKSK